jgi:hypothetical protein
MSKCENVIAIIGAACAMAFGSYIASSSRTNAPRSVEQPLETSKDFKLGTCLVRTSQIPDNSELEEFETKGVIRPEIRIEGIGIKRYLVRFLSSNDLVTDPQPFTEKDYINREYSETPCPEKFKNVPFGAKN